MAIFVKFEENDITHGYISSCSLSKYYTFKKEHFKLRSVYLLMQFFELVIKINMIRFLTTHLLT